MPVYTDVTDETFERDVLQRSREVPVVVDFWAEWCGPCRALGPILERLAAGADGGWTLAKVDVDSNPQLARQFGVRSIPMVKAFRDGREVAEFVGALPEPQVGQWLAQLGPDPADDIVSAGARAESGGDLQAAARAYGEALAHSPAHPTARLRLARVELRLRAAGADEAALRQAVEAGDAGIEVHASLADVEAARNDFVAAFERLVDVVRTASGDDRERARTHMLALLDVLSTDDPRAVKARRALSLALF